MIKINKKKEVTLENSNTNSNINKANSEVKEPLDDENTKLKINLQSNMLINDQDVTLTNDPNPIETNTNKTTSFKYLMTDLDLETNKSIDDDCALEITNLDVITENSDPIELKSHETIYLEIYRKAKQKAKEIRRNAVEAFLEAKNIKIKYNLTNIVNDSSSDEDN